MEVAKDFFHPEVDAAFSGIAVGQFNHGDTLGPKEKE